VSGGTESTTSGPPEWVRPYFEQFAQRAQQVSDLPYQPYSGATVAQLNPYQTAGLNATAARAMQGSPVTNAAAGELTKTLSGGYLNANPYLNATVDQAQGDVIRNYNNVVKPATESAMVRSGSFGNSGLQQVQDSQQRNLLDSLGNISTQIRGTDYANERNRMQGAIGMAPSIANQDYTDAQALLQAGGAYQNQDQANLSDTYQRFLEARNYPKEQLATQGMGLGVNYGQTVTGPGANKTGGMLGGGLAGAQLGGMVGGPIGAGVGGLGGAVAGGK
jgi:hypothetical protein